MKAPLDFKDAPGRAEERAMQRTAGPASYLKLDSKVPVWLQLWVIRIWLWLTA